MNVELGKWYTLDEIKQLRDHPDVAGLALKGYVLQQDIATGKVCFEHWSKAGMDSGRMTDLRTGEVREKNPGNTYGVPVETLFDKKELPPRTPRTGAQRVASMMEKVGTDLGHLMAAQSGQIPTGEEVRNVVQGMLEDSETEFQKKEDKKIVRTTGDPYA